jgi:GDP-mannose 6-dehydrogenase
MVASVDKVLDHAGTIVIGNAAPEFREVPRRLRESQSIVDLVRVSEARSVAGVYEGICW